MGIDKGKESGGSYVVDLDKEERLEIWEPAGGVEESSDEIREFMEFVFHDFYSFYCEFDAFNWFLSGI